MGTYNVCTLAFRGTNCIGHAEVILNTCEDAGWQITGLLEVRRNEQSAFTAVGYVVSCSGEDGGNHKKKGNHGGGLAAAESIVAGMDKGEVAVECISAILMNVRIQLKGESSRVSCIVDYAHTTTKSTIETDYFWSSLDEVVNGVRSRDHLLVCAVGHKCSHRRDRDRVDRQQDIEFIRTGRDERHWRTTIDSHN